MGGYEIYPNLYVVLVGEPAVVRKSTTVGFSEVLLTNKALMGANTITFAGDVTSHSKLLGALNDSPDSSVSITSGEFSSLVQTSPESMYELLTDIFDNKAKFKWETWAHGNNEITTPVVNLIAATTPAWMSKQPQEYFVGGGFASRVLFLYEEEPRQLEIYYDHVDHNELAKMEAQLVLDLRYISNLSGEFSHDSPKTKEAIRQWYKESKTKVEDDRLKGYYGRKHVHAHKIAMLLSLAERDDLKVTLAHWKEALKMLDYIETRMTKAFSTLGTNPFTMVMSGIVEYLDGKEKVTFQQIAGRFYREGLTLEQLKSALAFLETSGKVSVKGTISPTYTLTSKAHH